MIVRKLMYRLGVPSGKPHVRHRDCLLSLNTIIQLPSIGCFRPYIEQLRALLRGVFALGLAPQHNGVNQRLWRRASDMTKGRNELIELGVYSWPTDKFNPCLRLAAVCDALIDLQLCLPDEGVEEMVKRIFADRLQLVGILRVARRGTLLVMPSP